MAEGATPLIELEHVDKAFVRDGNSVLALRNFSLTIPNGQFVSVIGPSGCGKSTLLNLVAGLMAPSRGALRYAGTTVPQPNTHVGYVTQKDNLMPWRTVAQNVGISLEIARVARRERDERVAQVIELVGLHGFEHAFPSELSGGMRKRASLARTLIYDPDVVLFDEPFAALDAQLKLAMQAELLRICASERQRTMIFITHDVAEAILLADRVIACTPRPASVKLDRPVNLPKPRDVLVTPFLPEFTTLNEELWNALGVPTAAT